jgi:glutamine amidotransferase-like uncharacterized protein
MIDAKKNEWLLRMQVILLVVCTTQCNGVQITDVALYSDNGCWDESLQALENMFAWMGYTVTQVDAAYINKNIGTFKILCVPGGDMYQYSQDISAAGKENIRDFIRHGGAYIGICGGAYFAGEKVIWRGQQLSMTPLGLFSGMTQGPIDEIIPYPDCGMCKITIIDSTHPITRSEPDSLWVLYYWGPALIPDQDAAVTILGRYADSSEPAMLAFEYGDGRVFIIGTHPEIEEDSERDEVQFGDELDDRGSDWDIMHRAVLWCLKQLDE